MTKIVLTKHFLVKKTNLMRKISHEEKIIMKTNYG